MKILYYLQFFLILIIVSNLKVIPLYYMIVCKTYVLPQTANYKNTFQAKLLEKILYKVNIDLIWLHLPEL